MTTYRRLSEVFKVSKEIPFSNSSQLIFFSDCHRGDGSWADNFAPNKNLFNSALNYYYSQGFTYIEIGDGDELWENRRMEDITNAHEDTFQLLHKFHLSGRFYMIYGNHDMVKRSEKYTRRNLKFRHSYRSDEYESAFSDLKIHEGLILKHKGTNNKIFVVHGHQGDLINDQLWLLGRFLVRHFWKPLELYGVNNPTSPAKNYSRKGKVERNIAYWIKENKHMVIAGHTHRPMFPGENDVPYFNSGSCVHPDGITGIEIHYGRISLIKWCIKTKNDGTLYATREVIAGPRKLESFWE